MSSGVQRVRVGYLSETWGEITLDARGQPQFSGPRAAVLRELYVSLLASPLYHGLSPAQTLQRMTQRLTGRTWAVAVEDGNGNG